MADTFYFVWQIAININALQKSKLRQSLHVFGRQNDPQPYRITHGRVRLDGQAMLMVLTVTGTPTKADFISAVATEIGMSNAALNATSTFTLMVGGDVWQRAQSARDYVIANAVEWETS